MSPFSLPLINTFILLGRGFTITIFYYNLLKNRKDIVRFFLTLFLAIIFFPFYIIKDFFFIFCLLIFFLILIWGPFFFNDHEIFLENNHLVSPVHIVPE